MVDWRRQKEALEKAGPLSLEDMIASISAAGDSDEEGADEAADEAADPRKPGDKGGRAAALQERLRKRAELAAREAEAEEEVPRGARARRDHAAVAARKPPPARVEYDGGQACAAPRLLHEGPAHLESHFYGCRAEQRCWGYLAGEAAERAHACLRQEDRRQAWALGGVLKGQLSQGQLSILGIVKHKLAWPIDQFIKHAAAASVLPTKVHCSGAMSACRVVFLHARGQLVCKQGQ